MRVTASNKKDIRRLELSKFRGIDTSNTLLTVSPYRATNMLNFISRNGINEKRNGWTQVQKYPERIDGIFEFWLEDTQYIFVFSGGKVYANGVDITTSATVNPLGTLTKTKPSMFIYGNRAYFIGMGDFAVFGKWGNLIELRRVVDNTDTYIPKTTINILESTQTDIRQVLDDINIISTYRTNSLFGTATAPAYFQLDTTVDTDSVTVLKVNGVAWVIDTAKSDATDQYICDTGVWATATGKASIKYATGVVTFLSATTPSGVEDNIEITFRHAENDYYKMVTECSIGVLFGINGNADRLFLAGNPDYPNIDFHSALGDFTYFSDLDTASLGTEASKIMAYQRLSDDTLAIYKEPTRQEPNLFVRRGEWRSSYNSDGELVETRAIFSHSGGYISEGVISSYACGGLGGDSVILSPNGVFGLELSSNVVSQERFMKNRSRMIDKMLAEYIDDNGETTLDTAIAIVYNGRYYLAVTDKVFIADSRYRFQEEQDYSYQYEWWVWDNIEATALGTIGKDLFFGDADGRLCFFDTEFEDKRYEELGAGELSVNIADNVIEYNSAELLKENDYIEFGDDIYADIITVTESGGRAIVSSDTDWLKIHEEMEIYTDTGMIGNYLIDDLQYTETDGVIERSFALKTTLGVPVVITSGFRVCKKLTEAYITLPTDSEFQLKWFIDDLIPYKITAYNGSSPTLTSTKIWYIDNVKAEYFTPAFALGSDYSKSLLRLTISTEQVDKGAISFGYETRKVSKYKETSGMDFFSFEDLDFDDFTFETSFVNSYSRKVKERNFNYIIFKFESDNRYNCAIHSFVVHYKINRINKGVN